MNKQTIEINKSQIIDGDTVPFLVSYEQIPQTEPKTQTARYHPKNVSQTHSSTKSIVSNIPE